MVVDYIFGMMAAKKEAYENPNDRKHGWGSNEKNEEKNEIGYYSGWYELDV